jgi:hydrogenase/urease accessory protein HupE
MWPHNNRWLLGLLAALCLVLGPAVAHKGGTTGYATVSVAGQTVRYAVTLPADGVLLDSAVAKDLRDLAAAFARHVMIAADGTACAGVPAEVRPSSPQRASIEVVVLYACAAPIRNLSIRDGSDAVLGPDHHTIADIDWPGGTQQVVFESEHREAHIAITSNAQPQSGAASTFTSYFGIGVEHILLGFDHVLFIVALILPGGSLISIAAMVTAFTVAHSLTLALSVLNILTLPPQIVEPVIALSIAYVALENLTGKNALSRRWAVSFLFGLVHGFGFSNVLRELGLPKEGLLWSLLNFNLGVETGQAIAVLIAVPILFWLRKFRWEPRAVIATSVVVLAVGLTLFVQRALLEG